MSNEPFGSIIKPSDPEPTPVMPAINATSWSILDTLSQVKQLAFVLTTVWPLIQKLIALVKEDAPDYVTVIGELKDAISSLFPVSGFSSAAPMQWSDLEQLLAEDGGELHASYMASLQSGEGFGKPDGHRVKWIADNIVPLLIKYGPTILALL